MKNTTKHTFSFVAALAAAAASITPLAAQGTPAPGHPGDYLVHVGKRPVWASSLTKPKAPAAVSQQRPYCRDYPVTVGKRSVLASSLPQNRNADGTSPFCCVTNSGCTMSRSCCPA